MKRLQRDDVMPSPVITSCPLLLFDFDTCFCALGDRKGVRSVQKPDAIFPDSWPILTKTECGREHVVELIVLVVCMYIDICR